LGDCLEAIGQAFEYIIENPGPFWKAAGEHLALSFSALLLALVISFPLGIYTSRSKFAYRFIINLSGVGRVIPSVAVLILLYPLFGLGFTSAFIALTLLAIPPILINTDAGLRAVNPAILEAAGGMGMSRWQVLSKVELPLASPVILGGIRTATIEVIASATLASFIGAGGFGDFINQGLTGSSTTRLLVGAVPVALLAIATELLLGTLQRYATANVAKAR
jgi:osmoprotectant transport system permease protein